MSPFFAVVEGGEGEESINESCGVLFRNGRLAFLAFLLLGGNLMINLMFDLMLDLTINAALTGTGTSVTVTNSK